jgi:CRP-like cAMP-binding protein
MAAQETLSSQRRTLVNGVGLLQGLESELLHRVVDMLEPETKRAGEIVFEKGEFGDKLYIIESGEVSIVIDGKEVTRLCAGDYFGELALLNHHALRTANAVVAEGTYLTAGLLSIRRDNFESILGPLKVAMHASALSQIPFFAPLLPDQIAELAQSLQLRKFTSGATVIKAGLVDDAIYLVDQGSLEEESGGQFKRSRSLSPTGSFNKEARDVSGDASAFDSSSPDKDSSQTVVRRVLNKGSYFGEATLLTQTPSGSTVTVRSLGPSSVLSLSYVDIQKKVGSLVQVQQAWRRNAIEAWVKHAKDAGHDGGGAGLSVSATDIDVMIQELEVRCCKAGEVLADSDVSPTGCFVGVVMSGCVAVMSKVFRGGEGYSSKKLNFPKNPLTEGEAFDGRERSRKLGMRRKRLITEGPVDLPHKLETAAALLGDEGTLAGAKGQNRAEIKVVAASAAVLLVAPADPSPDLLRALASLDDRTLQSANADINGLTTRIDMGTSEICSNSTRAGEDGGTPTNAAKPERHVSSSAAEAMAPLPGRIIDDDEGSRGALVPTIPPGGWESDGQGGGSASALASPPDSGSILSLQLHQVSDGGGTAHVLHRSDHRGAIKIDPRSIRIIKAVGKGGFSRVFHVSCDSRRSGESRTRREFALKVIPIQHLVKNGVEHTVRHERDVMGSIKHPSIVRLYSAFKAHDHIYFVMDLVNGLDFYWCMQNYEISEKGAKFYLSQVVLMLEYLHSRTIAYRDIKPENLIIARDGYLRMIDFGLSKFLGPGERSYTFCGTPLYLAPEVWGSGGHNRAVDFWALGVFLYEVISGSLPWWGEEVDGLHVYILRLASTVLSYHCECKISFTEWLLL